jgi:hypothetical protein
MKRFLKRKDFAKWQAGEKLPDAALCKAVNEMESGLIDADLGGLLYKKRVARPGGGKSGGYRTLLSARIGSRYVLAWVRQERQGEHLGGREKGAAFRRQGVPGPVRGSLGEGVAVRCFGGGAL